MELQKVIEAIEESRERSHQIIDKLYDETMNRLLNPGKYTLEKYKVSMTADPSQFKGEKPEAVIFPDGRTIRVKTWRDMLKLILYDCNDDPERHSCLISLTPLFS